MGISNTIPPSRLIQPGVVANTAARPTSPFTGQTIYQVDTNQMLIWNGTAWVIPNQTTQNPEGLELVATATATGTATFLDVVGCFSATYDHYRIELSNFSNSNQTSDLYFRMLSGTTPVTTGTYGWAYVGFTSRGISTNSASFDQSMGYLGLGTANLTTEPYSASFDVFSPFLAKRTFLVGNAVGLTAGLNAFAFRSGGCYHETQLSYDGLRIMTTPTYNTIGTVRVYGYRNS